MNAVEQLPHDLLNNNFPLFFLTFIGLRKLDTAFSVAQISTLHVPSQLSSLIDKNEANNACLLHLKRCIQGKPLLEAHTLEHPQLFIRLPLFVRLAIIHKKRTTTAITQRYKLLRKLATS
ncbi:hypothetical protein T4D_198 [Trichinella pseudospiralis]|uniref:Uncharacterized protein n=1 Tax=Trichinella pseudospiralis TaxID=6337 RepID=A0A0V1F3P4_TRIPS|nr:hypothetical protein T4D_198 [Trichinella pseudospiralis]